VESRKGPFGGPFLFHRSERGGEGDDDVETPEPHEKSLNE
jgi:hypothetical protein